MTMLRLTISRLTGIGALVLVLALAGVAYVVVTLRRLEKAEKPAETGPLDVNWEAVLDEAIERAQRDAW